MNLLKSPIQCKVGCTHQINGHLSCRASHTKFDLDCHDFHIFSWNSASKPADFAHTFPQLGFIQYMFLFPCCLNSSRNLCGALNLQMAEMFNIRASEGVVQAHYANPGITCGPATLWHNRNTVCPNGPYSVNTSPLPWGQQKISAICKYTSEFKGTALPSLPFFCLNAQIWICRTSTVVD